jgi:hypothetical protein
MVARKEMVSPGAAVERLAATEISVAGPRKRSQSVAGDSVTWLQHLLRDLLYWQAGPLTRYADIEIAAMIWLPSPVVSPAISYPLSAQVSAIENTAM